MTPACPEWIFAGVTCSGILLFSFLRSLCSDGPCLSVLSGQGAELILRICLSCQYLCQESTCAISYRSHRLPSLTFYFFCGWSVSSLISFAIFVSAAAYSLITFYRLACNLPSLHLRVASSASLLFNPWEAACGSSHGWQWPMLRTSAEGHH